MSLNFCLKSKKTIINDIQNKKVTTSRLEPTTCKPAKEHSIISPLLLNGWVFVYKLSGCGFESCCSLLIFRYCVFLSREFLHIQATSVWRLAKLKCAIRGEEIRKGFWHFLQNEKNITIMEKDDPNMSCFGWIIDYFVLVCILIYYIVFCNLEFLN